MPLQPHEASPTSAEPRVDLAASPPRVELTASTALYEQMVEGVAVYGKDGRYLYANPSLERLTGKRRSELLGRTVTEVFPGPEAGPFLRAFERLLQTGEPQHVESSCPLPRAMFSVRLYLVGEQVWMFIHEVASREVRESEACLRDLADHAPVMLWVTDAEGRCTYLNQRWFAFTGQAESLGSAFCRLDAIHPDDVEGTVRALREAHERRSAFELEYRLRRHDGEYRWAFDSASPHFDEEGAFLGFIGSVLDISQRKEVEEQRGTLLRRAWFLSEATAMMTASLDAESTLAAVARRAVTTLGDWCLVDLVRPDGTHHRVEVAHAAPEDEALAQELRRFRVDPEGNPRDLPTRAFLQAEPQFLPECTPERLRPIAHSEEHARALLALQPVSFISMPLLARGQTLGVLTFISSRSGHRYTRAELILTAELARRASLSLDNARLYQEAQDAVRVRDEFLSVASHELKTPLTPISLRLQTLALESRKQEDSPFVHKVRATVESGLKQVNKLSSLIGDLLDVSRISGGRMRLECEDVDCAAVVREVVARYEGPATRAGSALCVELSEPVVGWWDRLRLDQVITNLLDNAIKYGAGRPIHIHLETDEERAMLRVRDEGIGIEPHKLPRIFERFERAVSERHYGGLGLGLYITKTLVEAMAGNLHVWSQPGQGATFTVELPRRPPPAP